jgi:phosphatidylglycerol lysyltransferase
VARWLGPAIGLIVIVAAIYVLRRQLDNYSYSDVIDQLAATPRSSVLIAVLLAAGAYAVLVGYDALALAYIGSSLPLRRIALGSFVAHSMSHSLGFHMITAGSIRYRFWSAWGLSNAQIEKALGFTSTSFLMGMVLVSGAVLLFEPPHTIALLRMPEPMLRAIGVLLILGVIAFLLWMRFARGPINIFGTQLQLPKVRMALGHLMIAASDWMMAASVAYVLLPKGHGVGLLEFIGVFLFALIVAAIGHVPGGLGVFESIAVTMLAPRLAPPQVLGPLILYRLIYYVLPFSIGLALMVAHETSRQGARMALAAERAARWLPATIAMALGVAVFSSGTILLLSSAVKMNEARMASLRTLAPLWLIEFSHFSAAILGAALLVLAWFVQRRMHRAFVVVSLSLAAAIAASLLRGLVWEVVLLLGAVLAFMLLSGRVFMRQEPLSLEPLSTAWITGIATVLLFTVWLGFFSFKNFPYSGDLWVRLALDSDLSRFLRAMAGVMAFLVACGVGRHFSRAAVVAVDAEG